MIRFLSILSPLFFNGAWKLENVRIRFWRLGAVRGGGEELTSSITLVDFLLLCGRVGTTRAPPPPPPPPAASANASERLI